MSDSVFARIEGLLNRHGVAFDVLRHEPVYTSEEAARVRDAPLASGAKALICKADDRFVLFVMPADRRLDSKGVRRARRWRLESTRTFAMLLKPIRAFASALLMATQIPITRPARGGRSSSGKAAPPSTRPSSLLRSGISREKVIP